MKISVNNKNKCYNKNTFKALHTKNYLLISSNYSVESLYKLLKTNQRIINNKDESNETLLSYAIKRKNLPIIELLLTSPMMDYSYQNFQGNTYLHLSVIYELISVAKALIQKGIDINAKNLDGNTALHYAYSVNNYKIIILLLQNKIDFNIRNNEGLTAEEIRPNSLLNDELIPNNNQINKTIIINWSDNDDKFVYKTKKSIGRRSEDGRVGKNFSGGGGLYCNRRVIKNPNSINDGINSIFDSKQETVRNNIFEKKLLPSGHQLNFNKCDLNFLNNEKISKKNLRNYKTISRSQYFNTCRYKSPLRNFSPLKLNSINDTNYIPYTERIHTNIIKDPNLSLDINLKRLNTNDNNNISESINKKTTTDNTDSNNNEKNKSLYDFLLEIKMEKYFNILENNGFDDINLLLSQMKTGNPITDFQLKEAGINCPGDRARILLRLEEKAENFEFPLPSNIYYSCENINTVDINENENVNKISQWLKGLNMGEYLDNFLINGYYNIELLLIQMISKNPLNDEVLKNEIEINKIGHRSRILNSLIEDAKRMYKNMKRKNKDFFVVTDKETKSCDCIII